MGIPEDVWWYCPDPWCLKVYLNAKGEAVFYKARCVDEFRHQDIESGIYIAPNGYTTIGKRPPDTAYGVKGHNGRHIPGQSDEYRLQGWTPLLQRFPAADQDTVGAAYQLGGPAAAKEIARGIVLGALPPDERRKLLSQRL